VFSTYGAAEALAIGFECQYHMGLHLNIDLYPIRIVDSKGKTLSDGKSGDVVVSNLVNQATVLLNYHLGDIAAILPDRCTCGRSLPLLSFPPGRSDDLIELTSGEIIHPDAVHNIFRYEEQIWQYQVVQQTSTHFTVAIVAAERCDRQQTKERIADKFIRTFSENVTVDISFVDSIDRTQAGKFRTVLSVVQRSRLGLIDKNYK